jgi:hypothetical protein
MPGRCSCSKDSRNPPHQSKPAFCNWEFHKQRFNPLILESIPLILLITQNFKKTTKIFFHPTSIWIVSSKVGLAVKAKPQKAVVVLVLGRRLVIIFQKGSSLGSGIRYHEGVCYTFTINGFIWPAANSLRNSKGA